MAYNATVSRPGRNQLVGADVTELLLKVFSGEVLSTFAANTVMRGLHTIRTITSGKAAQFIITGAAKSRFHVPGESLLDAANVGNALGNEANDAAHADKYADSIANTTLIGRPATRLRKVHYQSPTAFSSGPLTI